MEAVDQLLIQIWFQSCEKSFCDLEIFTSMQCTSMPKHEISTYLEIHHILQKNMKKIKFIYLGGHFIAKKLQCNNYQL